MLVCVNVWVLSVRNRLLLAVSAFVERVNQIPVEKTDVFENCLL